MRFDKDLPTWIKNLNVGDMVCDCRYKHLEIIRIEEDKFIIRPLIIRFFLYYVPWPNFIFDKFEIFYTRICRKFNFLEINDRMLWLSDGSSCSARYCCDPVNHDYIH